MKYLGILTALMSLNVSSPALSWAAEESKPGTQVEMEPTVSEVYSDPSKADPDAPIGSYRQPYWATRRIFPGGRSYLIPRKDLEAEFWFNTKVHRFDQGTQYLLQHEIEYGFADHLQFDFYLNEIKMPGDIFKFEGIQLELRYALADWGKLFLNPTFYFEYHPRNGFPDRAEIRLLLSETIAPNWHFVSNLGVESEFSGDQTHEYLLSAAIARSIVGDRFSVGVEAKTEWNDTLSTRGTLNKELYVGPSLRWRPSATFHIAYTTFIGVNDVSDQTQNTVIFGVDL